MADASNGADSTFRGPRRNEVFHAIRRAQANDGTIWSNITANSPEQALPGHVPLSEDRAVLLACQTPVPVPSTGGTAAGAGCPAVIPAALASRLPEFIGAHPALLEVSRRIRLVAPRTTSVLIEGPTGSGKELVARALHRLSPRSARKLIALNCAAIPEGLLEAELFGHTRGAFTGAVEGRMGRIEAAHGGTLFLDEIGDMPLALQSKLLRFLESGELQRVGDNESIHVDVRIVAATHRPLAMLAAKGEFRADLYYRLAVFLIRTPALKGRTQDVELLTAHFLHKFAQDNPAKQVTPECLVRLGTHSWPGNVRELEHVLERAWILAGERPRIDVAEIELDEPE
ncbi:MAG: sigma-54 dependent transcriptional regulator [Acidobacteriaceae bacterium]